MVKPINQSDVLEDFRNISFQVNRVVKFIKEHRENVEGYRTNLLAFIFPVDGEAEIVIDGDSYMARPGSLIHVCQNKEIRFRVPKNVTFTYINIFYTPNNKKTIYDYMNSVFELNIANVEFLKDHLENMCFLSSENNLPSKFKLQMQSNIFFRLLAKQYKAINFNNDEELVRSVVEYIGNNYKTNITLKKLEDIFDEKASHISYTFYKYMKIRPIDYLINYRINIAIKLISDNNYTVKEAALAVGYTDEFYFSRLFKKRFSIAPSMLKNR